MTATRSNGDRTRDTGPRPSHGGQSIDSRGLLPILSFIILIQVSNNSAGALAQPAIGEAFGAGPADVGWIVFGFGTTFAIGTALWGGLARRFGLGRSLTIGVLLVAAGSLAAAVAPSLPALIAARMVQGIGAGSIPTLAHSSVARMFEGEARARALGTIVASVGLGLALGPVLGGVTLELFGWRGPMAIGLVVLPTVLVLHRIAGAGDPGARIDVPGALLLAACVAAATFVLNRLPVLGLGPPTAIALAVLTATALLLVRRSARPGAFIPRRIVGDPAFQRVAVLGALGMTAFVGSLVLVPLAAARAHALDGIGLGLVLLPLATFGAVASRQSANVLERLGRRRTTLLSLCSLAGGAAAVGLAGPTAPPPVMAALLAPLGLGFGLLQSPLVNQISIAFGDADRPIAIGLYNLGFFVGGASGAAVATALVQTGAELPWFAGRAVPGFTTTEVLLALAPLLGVLILLLGMRRKPAANAERAAAP